MLRIFFWPWFLEWIVFVLERIRESIRGPYLIPHYLFANGVLVREKPLLDERGMLAGSPWFKNAYTRMK